LKVSKRGGRRSKKQEKEEAFIRFLEQHGPTDQAVLKEKFKTSASMFPRFARELFDKVERFKFTGKVTTLSANIFAIRNDNRLIDYVAQHIPKCPKTPDEVRTLVFQLKKHIGTKRAREVIKSLGYEYSKEPPESKKHESNRKFSNEQFMELYEKGLNDTEIANEFGVWPASVGYRRRLLNLPPNSRRSRRSKEMITCPKCGHKFRR